MIFSKNEIIELFGGKKYLVVSVINYENTFYYYICEITHEEDKVKDNFKIITAIYENGNFFVKTLKSPLKEKISAIFEAQLQ